MGFDDILNIPNRTENWKTAKTLAPVITFNKQHKLAEMIIANATKKDITLHSNEVCIELFWKGFRDYSNSRGKTKEKNIFILETAARYNRLFPNLRQRIENYNNQTRTSKYFVNLKDKNNYICNEISESLKILYDNLLNTEIDVVLNAPGFLLIGEVKHEQVFGANSKHVLTHQLVRQFVMASIVVDMIRKEQSQDRKIQIIPFIIGDNLAKYAQVKLIQHLGYLDEDNILSWDDISKLIKEYCNAR